MKIRMEPHLLHLETESGISTLIRKYFEYLPQVGVELVHPDDDNFDVIAQHAAGNYTYVGNAPIVAHLHGLYWTGDNKSPAWEFKENEHVIHSIRMAQAITVPSAWVAETLQRDMHITPTVLPHGIDWQEWQHEEPHEGYVLWNKNRNYDVCNPKAVGELARVMIDTPFVTTFAPKQTFSNVHEIGVQPHAKMRKIIQRSAVYLSSIKETFGIGTLEAMASGVPVLGFDYGGNRQLVKHGVNGYLAQPGDYADLAKGLHYCLQHRDALGENGRAIAKNYTWLTVAERLATLYERVAVREPVSISVIIPCYNYADKLERAVLSVLAQELPADEIIIVNNNSLDNTEEVASRLALEHPAIRYLNCQEQGVAHARNAGIRQSRGRYICCLDADDEIAPSYLRVCADVLYRDSTLGCVYTRMRVVNQTGAYKDSDWPGVYNYDRFNQRQNQVPTCCLFRRDLWARLGGYRQRYAPDGQGAEDAEFFWRMGAIGFGGALASNEPLFIYHLGGRTQQNDYKEVDWLSWHEQAHTPFASVLKPKQHSHPVYQYDEPVVSVIIPCGPNHAKYLIDALDSLENQSFKRWEAIVVFDGALIDHSETLQSYPFVRDFYTNGIGAGGARNKGAEHARAPLLLFLDADDYLAGNALQEMVDAYRQTETIIYSDYIGLSYIDGKEDLARLKRADRILHRDEQTNFTVVKYQSAPYNCEDAIRQPELINGQYYIWSLVTSLVPKIWHEEIGGFDEQMQSWEDWDYWLRFARADYCFTHIQKPLVNYRFHTGSRREAGGQLHDSLIDYLRNKYKGETPVCGNCSQSRPSALLLNNDVQPSAAPQVNPNDVLVRLIDGNHSDHPIAGPITRRYYNYHQHGEEFLMDLRDAQSKPYAFQVVSSMAKSPASVSMSSALMQDNPLDIVSQPVPAFDFTRLKDFPPDKVQTLNQAGIFTLDGFLNAPPGILENIFEERLLRKLRKAAQTS